MEEVVEWFMALVLKTSEGASPPWFKFFIPLQIGENMNETDTNKPLTIHSSLGGTVENIPEDVVWIDDAFYIKKTRLDSC